MTTFMTLSMFKSAKSIEATDVREMSIPDFIQWMENSFSDEKDKLSRPALESEHVIPFDCDSATDHAPLVEFLRKRGLSFAVYESHTPGNWNALVFSALPRSFEEKRVIRDELAMEAKMIASFDPAVGRRHSVGRRMLASDVQGAVFAYKKILVARLTKADLTSQNNFVYPKSGIVVCEDFRPTNKCGHGLHGFENGVGELNSSVCPIAFSGEPYVFQIIEVEDTRQNLVRMAGKVKYRVGNIVYTGGRDGYVKHMTEANGGKLPEKSMFGVAAGDRGEAVSVGGFGAASAGYQGAASAGYQGAASAGDQGAASAGYQGAASAGDQGAASAGYQGAASAGYQGAASAGVQGAASAGDQGAASAGYQGAASAGDQGAASAGYQGAASAGVQGAASAGYQGAASAGDQGAASAGYQGAASAGDQGAIGIGIHKNGSYVKVWGIIGETKDIDGEVLKAGMPYKLTGDLKFRPVPARERIEVVVSDITAMRGLQVIVNAANESLLGGGGVDGAIHKAAGHKLMEECKGLGGAQPGQVKWTRAHRLQCQRIAHAVGPRWTGGQNKEAETLAKCYREVIQGTVGRGLLRVGFPSISTGAFGYPLEQAAQVAIEALIDAMAARHVWVKIVCFDEKTAEAYRRVLKK